MSFKARSLRNHCAYAAFAVQALAFSSTTSALAPIVDSCVVQDIWANEKPKVAEPMGMQSYSVSTSVEWNISYKGTGANRLRGAEKARILRYGVLWIVDPAEVGATPRKAIRALLDSGAVIAREDTGGRVYFRAREENAHNVAQRAAVALGGANAGRTKSTDYSAPRMAKSQSGFRVHFGLKADIEMHRLEGRLSQSPLQFIEYIPAGMSVMPFGTGYVVHVRPADLPALRDFIEQEGKSVLLVGASGALGNGFEVGYAIRRCGGRVLANRFPTPTVVAQDWNSALIDVENLKVNVFTGDTVLVVQKPLNGTGLELAILRFGN